METIESTEGIHTRLVQTTFDPRSQRIGPWKPVEVNTDEIVKEFNEQVLAANKTEAGGIVAVKVIKEQTKYLKASKMHQGLQNVAQRDFKPQPRAIISNITSTDQPIEEPSPQLESAYSENQEIEESKIQLDEGTLGKLYKLKKNVAKTETEDNLDCLIRLWDHGGQFEFSATHRLFLEAEALYLIVMDITKQLHDDIPSKFNNIGSINAASIPQTAAQFLDYWISAILQKVTSKETVPTLALVLTHRDLFIGSVDDYIFTLLDYLEKKGYGKYITKENIFVVDNKGGNEEEFLKLRMKIFQMVKSQKTWGQERPTRWLKLEAAIHSEASRTQSKYLNASEVQELGLRFGIAIEETQSFLNFHHAMGDFIYFNHPELKHQVITDHQWLVDAFKAVITPHEFLEKRNMESDGMQEFTQKALTTKSLLETLWKGNDVQFLIHLMQQFNLLLPIEHNGDEKYLIPCMLPPRKPDMYQTEPFSHMKMTYSASYTGPDNMMSVEKFHGLIVKMSKTTNWRLCDFDHFTYTDVSFKVKQGVRVSASLLETNIRVNIWYSKLAIRKGILSDLQNIYEGIEKAFTSSFELRDGTFLLSCPALMKNTEDRLEAIATGDCLVRFKKNPKGKIQLIDNECSLHKTSITETDYKWFLQQTTRMIPSPRKQFPTLVSKSIGE